MSERKPGVSSSAPPKMISTPSATSRAGARPPWSASLNRRQAARPCERMSSEPRMESAISSAMVHHTPMAEPTWMMIASSAIGTRMKSAMSRKGISPSRLRPRAQARLKRAAQAGAAAEAGGCMTCTDGSRWSPTSSMSVFDVRLRMAQPEGHPVGAQAAREARQVDHQRRVREVQLGQVDDDVAGRPERHGERPATPPARRPVLVPGHVQHPQLFVEGDDAREPRQICG